MEKVEIIHALENLGLSNYEAKAYLAILSEPPLTGYKLSKISGVPRSRIYETIEKLTAKGLVLSQEGETTLLKAVDFESFLAKKEKENKQNIEFLRNILPQIEKTTEDQGIWNISGKDQIIETVRHLVSQANTHIYLLGFSDDLFLYETSLSEAEKRNVVIFTIYCGNKIFKVGKAYSHQGQPCTSCCREIACSFDSKHALVGNTFPPDDAQVALTNNPGIIYVIEQYIKHEIFISQTYKYFDQTALDKLRKIYQQVINTVP